jgi:tetratricopeptide (TPR) repeat protein
MDIKTFVSSERNITDRLKNMKKTSILFFSILPLLASADEAKPPIPANPPSLSSSDREDLYEDYGMNYAKDLFLGMDGSPEDEVRSKKAEILNYQIRDRGIRKLESRLTRANEPRIRQEIFHRLSQLYEQQAEIVTRRSDLKDKDTPFKQALRNSNRHLENLRREFPNFAPDATIFNLAENHSKLKEDKKAETYYRDVINRYPKSPVVADSLLSLGNLYFERQAFFTARSFYQKILSTDEAKLYPWAHYKMAWCYFNESDFPSAIGRLEQSIHESRKLTKGGNKKLGVEEEALSDLVLFFAEFGNPTDAKAYFEKLVDKEKANELRYQLARRLFDHGKHATAKDVAKELLAENPQKEFVNKLYLILISVAERTKDRDFGLKTAEKLSTWIKDEKLAESDTSRIESEEYMRNYSQKLHHEAETMKQGEVWSQARKSYEIYLNTFPNEKETPEVKFRYAVLLMNRKEQLKAYQAVSEAVASIDQTHPRFKEALKLKIQSIEMATKDERKKIDDKDLLASYDLYAKNYPDEELGIEAKFKAANLAKELETPEQAAGRFRAIAEAHPKHNLAKASLSEALAVLVKAQKWEALGNESRAIAEKTEIQSSLLEGDADMKKKIAEARELSMVKISENLENEGKLVEAKSHYEKILAENPSETMGIYSLVKLAALAEQKMANNREAIQRFEQLKEKYPSAKEARQASLELARLYEKVNEPQNAVRYYLEFAKGGNGKIENQATTNAAVLLETLGEREQAAAVFFQLAEGLKNAPNKKDYLVAYEAGCNNILLSTHQTKERNVLEKVSTCARDLGASGEQAVIWQARGAWAMDQLADNLQAEERWKRLSSKSIKASSEAERAYIAMAKVKMLDRVLADYKTIRFAKTNERPEANIGKKTQALEELERQAETVVKIGTPKQVLQAKEILRAAYLDFADTMETAAVPSKLSDAEKEELKKSFLTFANEFKEKAKSFENTEDKTREVASEEGKKVELKLSSLSSEESRLLEQGLVPKEKATEIFAKKAFASFKNGKFGEARYFGEKWKKELESGGTEGFGKDQLDLFQAMLTEKIPDLDPVGKEF